MDDRNCLSEIIANEPLSVAIQASVEAGLKNARVILAGSTFDDVIQAAMDAAIRDINEHPKGKLFQRPIEYGPLGAAEVEVSGSGRELSDVECGECVEFIHSHMVNRFKGELAEMLAIEPCAMLAEELQGGGVLPGDIELHFGDTIQERKRFRGDWAEFAKGADGLIVRHLDSPNPSTLELHGVIEVKSMYRSKKPFEIGLNVVHSSPYCFLLIFREFVCVDLHCTVSNDNGDVSIV